MRRLPHRLTPDQIREVRLLEGLLSYADIGWLFSISRTKARFIIKHRRWTYNPRAEGPPPAQN
jgi:hypothetical protein